MQKSNFKDWTPDKIDDAFGTTQVRRLPILEELLAFQHEADDYERRYLSNLSENYLSLGGDDWNEVELENKLISPVIVFSGIESRHSQEREEALLREGSRPSVWRFCSSMWH